jgi:hypothetical protein
MSEEKLQRNPVEAMLPDIDPGEKPTIPRPQEKPWRQVGVLLVIGAAIGIIATVFHLTERDVRLGLCALLTGLALGDMYGRSEVRRANERDPVAAICRTIESMDENGHWIFSAAEEQAVARLQRILKMFREKMPR